MAQSISSRILASILKVSGFKQSVEKQLRQRQPARSQKDFTPKRITKSYTTAIRNFNGKTFTTFEKKGQVRRQHIFFLHGGAYVFKASALHWSLAEKIVRASACRMTMVDYPLAPEHQYSDTYEMVEGAYQTLIEAYPDDDFIFMGDSAGAGLALGFSMKLRADSHPKPPVAQLLLSPWLDATMSHPDIPKFAKRDHILTVDMLLHAAKLYAGDASHDFYQLSPMYGDFEGLAQTLIFYGTEEIFYPDCVRLQQMIKEINPQFIFKEYQGMQHDWPIFPIPERTQVIHDICEFLKE